MEQKKRVIALGFFDGVHNGHAALMRRTAQVAREIGATPAAFTFDPHPQTVILGRPMPLLTSPEDRADLMRKYYGIQDVIVEPFTPQRMKQPWREFLEETLVGDLGAVHLVAGHDYHYGSKGEGDPQRLQQGFQICRVSLHLRPHLRHRQGPQHRKDLAVSRNLCRRCRKAVVFHPIHLIDPVSQFCQKDGLSQELSAEKVCQR